MISKSFEMQNGLVGVSAQVNIVTIKHDTTIVSARNIHTLLEYVHLNFYDRKKF